MEHALDERFFNVRELSARYNVHEMTIRRWVREGKFPLPVKLGKGVSRWKASDLVAFEKSTGGGCVMEPRSIEATARYCAEQARDLCSGEKALSLEMQEILQRRFARAIGHKVRVHVQTMTRAEVEAFIGAAIPPDLIPVFCLAVGVTPDGFPAFVVHGFLANRQPTPEEIGQAEKGALDAFRYGDDTPRFKIEQGTRH